MQASSSLTEAQREAAIELFEQGLGSYAAATRLGVKAGPVRDLRRRWCVHGVGALMQNPTMPSYSYEFKLEVVQRFSSGVSAKQLAQEFGLSSELLVRKWARIYRSEGEQGLQPKRKGPPPKTDTPPPEISDLERLQKENLRLRAENAYLKKLRALRAQGRQ